MPVSTLTSKGRTTIPKEIRRRLGLKPGDRLRFLLDDDSRVVIVPATVPVRSLYGVLPAPDEPATLEEMDEAIRARAVARSSWSASIPTSSSAT